MAKSIVQMLVASIFTIFRICEIENFSKYISLRKIDLDQIVNFGWSNDRNLDFKIVRSKWAHVT